MWTLLGPQSVLMFKHRQQRKTVQMYVDLVGAQSILMFKHLNIDNYVEVSRNTYMKLDEIKKSNRPILDLSDVFCVPGY